ncbi:MAG TPA: hypothetical protein VHJ20_13375 [Polyangia bacterium]|nr:hypothetical protein [Polyangia bacterium]
MSLRGDKRRGARKARPATPALARPRRRPDDDVLEKYRKLALKYRELVKKLDDSARARRAASRIVRLAMRELPLAVSVVRADRIELTNARWSRLAVDEDGMTSWQHLSRDGGASASQGSLRSLTLAYAAAARGRDGASPAAIFERVSDGARIEIHASAATEADEVIVMARALPDGEAPPTAPVALGERMRNDLGTVAHDLRNAAAVLGLVIATAEPKANARQTRLLVLLDGVAKRTLEAIDAIEKVRGP